MKSQKEKILEYLQAKKIMSSMDAFNTIGCTRLAARISDLRAEGHRIETSYVRNKHGKTGHWVYILEESNNTQA